MPQIAFGIRGRWSVDRVRLSLYFTSVDLSPGRCRGAYSASSIDLYLDLYRYRHLHLYATHFLYLLAADESHPVTKLPPLQAIHLPTFTNEALCPRVSS